MKNDAWLKKELNKAGRTLFWVFQGKMDYLSDQIRNRKLEQIPLEWLAEEVKTRLQVLFPDLDLKFKAELADGNQILLLPDNADTKLIVDTLKATAQKECLSMHNRFTI